MANTDIKWFSFDNTNAPQLSNTWGCMIDVLNACLVTGYGAQQVLSIVVSSGVGIATFGGVHNIQQFQVVEFSGSTNQAINNEFKVLGLTATTIEFLIDVPDQTITDTISCKIASLGWTRAFSGAQKAVYQAKDTIKNPYFLRVDNSCDPVYTATYAKFAKVGILETCNGIDDFSGNQAPFDAANPNKNWVGTAGTVGWFKWVYAAFNNVSPGNYAEHNVPDGGVRSWVLVGNSESFYILPSFMPISKSSHIKNTYGFALTKKETGISMPILVATNKNTPASSTLFFNSALNNLSNATIASTRNIKGELENTRFMTHLAPLSLYSGHAASFTRDQDDGVVLTPLLIKDQDGYFAGHLDLIRYVFYDISQEQAVSLVHENNETHLLVRALFQANSSYGYGFGGWAFDLGGIQ